MEINYSILNKYITILISHCICRIQDNPNTLVNSSADRIYVCVLQL